MFVSSGMFVELGSGQKSEAAKGRGMRVGDGVGEGVGLGYRSAV